MREPIPALPPTQPVPACCADSRISYHGKQAASFKKWPLIHVALMRFGKAPLLAACTSFSVLFPWIVTVICLVLLPSLLSATTLPLSAVAVIVCVPFFALAVYQLNVTVTDPFAGIAAVETEPSTVLPSLN